MRHQAVWWDIRNVVDRDRPAADGDEIVLLRPPPLRYRPAMARQRRYLTATMADGYVKTIGPTAAPFTHYWRIVAYLRDGKTEVFWGHANSAREAASKEALTRQAAKRHGWTRFDFEVVELTESKHSYGRREDSAS